MNFGIKASLVLFSFLLGTTAGQGGNPTDDQTRWVCVESGVASWYGAEEQGKLTASGETFDRREFTAASRHLPFNTVVRVTNRLNGRSVEVRINDRGPWVKGRVLDLSEAAAMQLQMIPAGVAPVDIEVKQTPTTTEEVSLASGQPRD
jgi:rare lipoprotein A